MLVYATVPDYLTWTGLTDIPDGVQAALRSASLAVQEATELAIYNTDATGMPTDPVQLQAMNDATCSQAAAIIALRLDPLAGGTSAEPLETSSGIGTAKSSFSAADIDNVAAMRAQVAGGLVLEAQRILRNARLQPTQPWVVG